MNSIAEIGNPDRIFTLEEANALLPLVKRICLKHENTIKKQVKDYNWLVKTGAGEYILKEQDAKIHKEIIIWGSKLTKLGIKVMGDLFMGFNAGNSFYWSYRYPETKIEYWHGLMEDPRISRHKLEYLEITK